MLFCYFYSVLLTHINVDVAEHGCGCSGYKTSGFLLASSCETSRNYSSNSSVFCSIHTQADSFTSLIWICCEKGLHINLSILISNTSFKTYCDTYHTAAKAFFTLVSLVDVFSFCSLDCNSKNNLSMSGY